MPSASLEELFTHIAPHRPDHNLALEASFGLQDIERLLRENKEMRAKLRDIEALITQWEASEWRPPETVAPQREKSDLLGGHAVRP